MATDVEKELQGWAMKFSFLRSCVETHGIPLCGRGHRASRIHVFTQERGNE
jgi:hypothetical protein